MSREIDPFETILQYDRRCAYPPCWASEKEKGISFKECSGCKGPKLKVLYCSRECQKSHWPKHKSICGVAAKIAKASSPMSKRESKKLGVLTRWRLAAREYLTWTVSQAFKMNPPGDSTENFLKIDLGDVDGPHGPHIAPTRMRYVTMQEYVLHIMTSEGLTVEEALRRPSPTTHSGRVLILVYGGVGGAITYSKEELESPGFTGPYPSTRQWPLFFMMATILMQATSNSMESHSKWEARLHGWVQLGFDDEYPILRDFSLQTGWAANGKDYILFEEAIKKVDGDQRVSAQWAEKYMLGMQTHMEWVRAPGQGLTPERFQEIISTILPGS